MLSKSIFPEQNVAYVINIFQRAHFKRKQCCAKNRLVQISRVNTERNPPSKTVIKNLFVKHRLYFSL